MASHFTILWSAVFITISARPRALHAEAVEIVLAMVLVACLLALVVLAVGHGPLLVSPLILSMDV